MIKKILSFISFYSIEKPLFYLWKMSNRGKEFSLSCYYPFYYMGIDGQGTCYLCCERWLPQPVGNLKSKPIQKIFNSIHAQRIRIAAYRGKLKKYCNIALCDIVNTKSYKPFTVQDILNAEIATEKTKKEILKKRLKLTDGPSRITDGISTACNVRCKFCYNEENKNKEFNKSVVDEIKSYVIENTEKLRVLNFSAAGEPFIQKYVKDIIRSVKNNRHISLYFTSNLNYIDDETRSLLREVRIAQLHASINAANKETYNRLVSNGNWENVMQNLEFFIELKEKTNKNMRIQISMVVTNLNYLDIIEFAKMGISRNIDKIIFYPMTEGKSNQRLIITRNDVPQIEKMLRDEIFNDSRVEIAAFRDYIHGIKISKETRTYEPLVSIIIPAFNRAETILKALHSVQIQDYKNWELIVVDDGSLDATAKTVHQFSLLEDRVKLISHGINRGAQTARNTGIRAAQGEWVAFLDSDDQWLPESLNLRMEMAMKEGADVVHSGAYIQHEHKQPEPYHLPTLKGKIYGDILANEGPMFQSLLVKKKALERIGLLDERIRAFQEWDTSIRLAKHYKFAFVPTPTYIYDYGTPNAISRDSVRNAIGYEQIVSKHWKDIIFYTGIKTLARHYGIAAQWYKSGNDSRGVRRCTRLASLLKFLSVRTVISKIKRRLVSC